MSNITIDQLEPDLSHRLEQRAAQHGRTNSASGRYANEAEIKSILSSVLIPEPSPQLVGGASFKKHLPEGLSSRGWNR